jgi:lysophospholipase L1-like esterase
MKPERTIAKLIAGTPIVMVAFGDSLTYGWMVSKGYLDYFKERIAEKYPDSKVSLINRGIPGDTAQGGSQRVERDVIRRKPDCTLVQYALNDAFVGYSHEQFKANIEMIVTNIREQCESEIVLVSSVCLGSEKENAFIERFYNQLEALACDYQLSFARVHEYWKKKISEGVDFESLVQFDNVHPNTEGYRFMAEAVMEVF